MKAEQLEFSADSRQPVPGTPLQSLGWGVLTGHLEYLAKFEIVLLVFRVRLAPVVFVEFTLNILLGEFFKI